ncbi:hypothetical protein RND71_006634 [Anisodus tanguticus]|uniref:Uncharacterized protein n=1 Tax=Anisodus tanguticus TaxID=243964 RepID=A0AAE1STR0_9SOLA|nr:hypothetical protein RND71_006634 [Anisodus tanguticus]
MVIDSLDRLITTSEERKKSVIVEGVHLSLNFVSSNVSRRASPFVHKDKGNANTRKFFGPSSWLDLRSPSV